MRGPNLEKWANPGSIEGLLVFAQSLDELLFDYSLDTFKTPALNLHVSIHEVYRLLGSLAAKRITKRKALEFAIEELEHHLRTDPVPPRPLPHSWRICFGKMRSLEAAPKKLVTYADALLLEIGSVYWKSLKSKLIIAVQDPHKKKDIVDLTRAFSSEIELRGYSRRFAYYVNNRYFFDPTREPLKVDSCSLIRDFFNEFESPPRNMNVIFRGSKKFEDYSTYTAPFDIQILSERPTTKSSSFKVNSFLGRSSKFPNYIVCRDVPACDAHRARTTALYHIETFINVCRYAGHKARMNLSDRCLIDDPNSQYEILLSPPQKPMLCYYGKLEGNTDDTIRNAIQILSGKHFSRFMRYSFRKVLEYHDSALKAHSYENQLMNLWSALEGFLPVPANDGARIEYYMDKLVPLLTLKYSHRIFTYIADSLIGYSDEVAALIESINCVDETVFKTMALLVCSEYQEERRVLCELIDSSPYLRYRAFWCYKTFSNNIGIREAYGRHQERIRWHIRRIYTTRNQIAHNASSMPYLPTLVENLHCYVDMLINRMIEVGTKSENPIRLGGVLEQMENRTESLLLRLAGDREFCNTATFIQMLTGKGC